MVHQGISGLCGLDGSQAFPCSPGIRTRGFGVRQDLTAEYRALSMKSGLSPEVRTVLATALNQIVSLWVKLWAIEDSAGLNALLVNGGDITQCTIQLEQVKALLGSGVRRSLTTATAALFSASSDKARVEDWFRSPGDLDLPANDQRRAKLLEQRITRSDVQSSLFAGFVGLLTGLNLFYVGKPFGTFADYVSLFLWAAGTKAALDILLAVIDKLAAVNNHS
jgi:hypothetical protein